MSQNNNSKKVAATVTDLQSGSVEVLYQKMGDRWFAFSMINDEVFVGSISPEELNGDLNAAALEAAIDLSRPSMNSNA
ncbi:MAG: hypothetical protein H7222_10590 [Methylotenera sp.]|nr:hypothetical protein [Oligoflexia bacterium]